MDQYYAKQHALITGASTGLGAHFAEELARRGCDRLTLVARSEDKLNALAERLRAEHGCTAEVVVQDLCRPGAVATVVKGATRVRPVDILINNAGFGACGRFEEQGLATQLQEVQLNIAALVEMTHALLPGMRARRRGGVLNVASTAAFQPAPYFAIYAASKSFVLSLGEALWAENRGSGVNVTVLCSGPTDTAFFERMGHDLPSAFGAYAAPLPVVCAGLDALAKGRSTVVPGLLNYLSTQGERLLPRRAVALLMRKMMAPREHAASPTMREATVSALDMAATNEGRLAGGGRRRRVR